MTLKTLNCILALSIAIMASTPSGLAAEKNLHFWTGAGGSAALAGSMFGPAFQAGYKLTNVGFDVRYMILSGNYQGISTRPSPSDTTFTSEQEIQTTYDEEGNLVELPNPPRIPLETERTRNNTDPWKMKFFEPGVNYISSLPFGRTFDFLRTRLRAGFGYGSAIDDVNKLNFKAWLFSYDAALQFTLGAEKAFVFETGFTHRFGKLDLENAPTQGIGRLPVNWASLHATLMMCF